MTTPAISLKPHVEPKAAVARFLSDMAKVAQRTFPTWEKTMTDGIGDCPLTYDQRRDVLEIHPLDDTYFAGIVALEAAKIRTLFAQDEASELLSLLAEQVDAAADRTDRYVSDLVFVFINRIEIALAVDKQKMPYDQVMKAILQRLGVDKIEATKHLMTDFVFRHALGEPLAVHVPQWWKAFHSKYSLTGNIEHAPREIRVEPPIPPKPQPPAKPPRRAVAFL